MVDRTSGPARARLSTRDRLSPDELEAMQQAGTLVVDDRRRRPLYFDGRFLAARDLTRDQTYFLGRQADLGRALGAGVVQGLMPSPGPGAFSVNIAPGHGVTGSGEMVALTESLTVDLAALPDIQRLNGAFGLSSLPHTPPRSLSGLFVLGLRAVEFTADPIASYPTSIDGERSVHHGSIVEGVAATLIPYRDQGSGTEMHRRRARTARDIFVEGDDFRLTPGVLPLAMLALDRGGVQWVDPYLVRREVGPEHGDVMSFGFAPRALRQAQFFQYEQQLVEIMALRDRGDGGQAFAASDYFYALPPAGRLPAGALNTDDFTQTYFPAEVDVELSIVPSDEVPVLLEEAMRLPPLDLSLSGEELESTSVMVLAPVERRRFRGLKTALEGQGSQGDGLGRTLRPAAPGLVSRRKPLEVLRGLRTARLFQPAIQSEAPEESLWAAEINRASAENDGLLWYVRRRNLSYKAEVVGSTMPVEGDETGTERAVAERVNAITTAEGNTEFPRLRESATSRASAEMVSLFSSPTMERSTLLTRALMRELERTLSESGSGSLTRREVRRAGESFSGSQVGEGIARLEAADSRFVEDRQVIKTLAESDMVVELDQAARKLPQEQVKALAERLADAAASGDTESVKKLVEMALRG